ncbi:MAG TPA: hypothetical protein VI588_03430, partial [Candidatus Gracilibacteria bacterium]|nr:hypothetical protein [Candidatus Gracilibacteria bacterium]
VLTGALFLTTTGLASASPSHKGLGDGEMGRRHRFGNHLEKNCEAVKERIENKIEKRGEKSHEKGEKGRIGTHIEKMLTRFEDAGLDTSKLKEYLGILEQKITALKAERESLMVNVEKPIINCEATKEERKAAMEAFRAGMEPLRDNKEEIHTYMKETVHPEIKSLREQLKGSDDEESDEE